jgi:hypothetical protein
VSEFWTPERLATFRAWQAAGYPGHGSPEHRAVFPHDYPPTTEEFAALAGRFAALGSSDLRGQSVSPRQGEEDG